MVEWVVNGQRVTLEPDGAAFVVHGPSGVATFRRLEAALAAVSSQLHRLLTGATGLGGWSLLVQFDGVSAGYGDGLIRGGRGGSVSDTLACANRVYDPRLTPHPAVENSVQMVKSCWQRTVSV
jgi:hypothetical protein